MASPMLSGLLNAALIETVAFISFTGDKDFFVLSVFSVRLVSGIWTLVSRRGTLCRGKDRDGSSMVDHQHVSQTTL